MHSKIKIVKIDTDYCNYLRKYDNKVYYNDGIKDLRPFIGILFEIDNMEYFAPLSSPKPKHKLLTNTLDLIKIDDGKYGVVNFNNMIPVTNKNYIEFNLNRKTSNREEKARLKLLSIQLRWLTANKKIIYAKSRLLYKLYRENKLPDNVKNRCCNFMLLENKCLEYNKLVTV